MDGILIPIGGVLLSGVFAFTCILVRRLRPFLLAAIVTPFFTSITFLLGAFALADMNPAREYGTSYIPTGKEHDPTRMDYAIWILVTLLTSFLSFALAYFAQKIGVGILKGFLEDHRLGRWLEKRSWFGLAK